MQLRPFLFLFLVDFPNVETRVLEHLGSVDKRTCSDEGEFVSSSALRS